MIDTAKILQNLKIWYSIKDTSQDELLKLFINVATDKLLVTRYPFDLTKTIDDLHDRDSNWILRASRSIYDSQGAYNIKQFAQNGISITYGSAQDGISQSLIDEIVPKVGIPK